jgi:hypothetical protein
LASNEYAFLTRWRVEATREEAYDVIADGESLARWWPSVYLEVKTLVGGDATGRGRITELWTKGFLPYTLRWRFLVTDAVRPERIALDAMGDFVGRGVWTFESAGAGTDVVFDWRLRAEKPLLRALSFLLKPVFSANHRWAMARGEESLKLELRRRRAQDVDERALIPDPPGPTFPHGRRRRSRPVLG